MPTLPYPSQEDVKVFSNEYINVNTMNRALLRLFYNDNYLSSLSSLDPVDLPIVSNMLLVSTGPGTYTWKTDTEAKSLLNITDSLFGLVDVDDNASNMLDGYGVFWDSTKDAFVGKKGATALNDLDDVIVTSPVNLQSIVYSSEYGSFINGFPSDFTVGYVTNVTFDIDGKAVLPEVTAVGQQIVVTKLGTTTDVYVVPNAANKINGQSGVSLKSSNTSEYSSSISLRSVALSDESIEWVTISGDGSFEYISSGLVPGSSISTRTITNDDLMLQPYSLTISGVPDASESTKGIIQIATDVEAIAGTEALKCVNTTQMKYFFDNYVINYASNADFKTGSDNTKVVNVEQAHFMDSRFMECDGAGATALSSSAAGTRTFTIANLTSPDSLLDTDEIRGVWVEWSGASSTTEASAEYTDPTGRVSKLMRTSAYGGGDSVSDNGTFMIPINKGQTSFDIEIFIGSGASLTVEVYGIQCRVFEAQP
jgi:hypothetical protein